MKNKARGTSVLEPLIEYEGSLFTLAEIPVTMISVPKERFRSVHNKQSAQALRSSVRIMPLINEIGVLQKGKKYELIYGEARLQAAIAQGGKSIKAKVWKFNEGQAYMAQLVENFARGGYDKVALMDIIVKVMETGKIKQKDIAAMLGISESDVSKIVGLKDLEPEIKTMISDNKVSFDTAQEIKRIPSDKGRVEHAQVIAHQGFNRDEARDYVKHTVLSLCDNCGEEDKNKALELIDEKWYCHKCAPKFRPKVEPKPAEEGHNPRLEPSVPAPETPRTQQEEMQILCTFGGHNVVPRQTAEDDVCRTHIRAAALLFEWFEENTQYDAYAVDKDMLAKMKVVPKK